MGGDRSLPLDRAIAHGTASVVTALRDAVAGRARQGAEGIWVVRLVDWSGNTKMLGCVWCVRREGRAVWVRRHGIPCPFMGTPRVVGFVRYPRSGRRPGAIRRWTPRAWRVEWLPFPGLGDISAHSWRCRCRRSHRHHRRDRRAWHWCRVAVPQHRTSVPRRVVIG